MFVTKGEFKGWMDILHGEGECVISGGNCGWDLSLILELAFTDTIVKDGTVTALGTEVHVQTL